MIAFGYGVVALGTLDGAGWLHGLKLAAVAVVAHAVWTMGRSLCPDRARLCLALAAAAVLLGFPGALVQVGVIVGGGALGWWWYRGTVRASEATTSANARQHLVAAGLLLLCLLLLFVLPVVEAVTGWREVAVFDSFYRAGALVFGGGHVVLPLLRAEVVPNGWVTDDTFLAGYGAAQALPGPLFTFAGYLGTAMQGGSRAWVNGLWCLLAIFLPAWLLIGGALPFWHRLRTEAWMQAALRGTNAAVVGLLLAAFYDPVWKEGVRNAPDVAAVALAFTLLQWRNAPPWLVVLLAAAAGQWVIR
jgi:chromate transporter